MKQRPAISISAYPNSSPINFSKRTWVFAEYRDSEFCGEAGAVSGNYFGYEYQMFAAGIRHEF